MKPFTRWLRVVEADPDGRVLHVIGGMFDELLLDARSGARCGTPSRNLAFHEGHPGVSRYARGSYEGDVQVARTDGPEVSSWVAPWKGTLAGVAADGAVVVANPRGGMMVLDLVPGR